MEDKLKEWKFKILKLTRVTKVTAGGKKFKIQATVAVGNEKGKVGIAIDKGDDVALAVEKARKKAIKNLIEVPIKNGTIPHEVYGKYSAAKVILKPAKKGHGLIAGGAVRVILSLAGIQNAISKILGHTKNPLTNALACFEALKKLKKVK